MNFLQDSLEGFLAREHRLVIVEIASARGSTPRDEDAFMLVSPSDVHGTNLLHEHASGRALDVDLRSERCRPGAP